MTAAELRARECVAELTEASPFYPWSLAKLTEIVRLSIEAALEDEREAQRNAAEKAREPWRCHECGADTIKAFDRLSVVCANGHAETLDHARLHGYPAWSVP